MSNEVQSKKEEFFIIVIKSRNNHAGSSNHIVRRINKFQLYDPFTDPREYPLYILKILNIRFYTGFSHCAIFVAALKDNPVRRMEHLILKFELKGRSKKMRETHINRDSVKGYIAN